MIHPVFSLFADWLTKGTIPKYEASFSGELKFLKFPISARIVAADVNSIPGMDMAIFRSFNLVMILLFRSVSILSIDLESIIYSLCQNGFKDEKSYPNN